MQGRILLVVLALTVALSGCTTEYDDRPGPDDDGIGAGGDVIRMHDDFFSPDEVSAAVGDTFLFRNDGDSVHSVTVVIKGDEGRIREDVDLLPGQDKSVSVDRETVYIVFCRYHGTPDDGMRMTIDAT